MSVATSSFTTPTLSSITSAADGIVTIGSAHGWQVGDVVSFQGLTEMTELNGTTRVIRTVPDTTSFTIGDTSAFSAETTGGADTCNLAVDVSGYLRTGKKGENVTVAISGTYSNALHLERAITPDGKSWEKVMPVAKWDTDNATVSEIYRTRHDNEILRLVSTAAAPTGTTAATLTDGAKVIQSYIDDDGNELWQLTEDGIRFRGTATVDGASTLTGNVAVAGTLDVTGATTLSAASTIATGTTVGNLTLADGSITDSSGAISFGNETLTTTGIITGAGNKTTLNVGTPGTNVTAVEWGDGYNHITVLTLTGAALLPTIPADAEAAGAVIYTFPAGVYVGTAAHMDITAAVVDTATNAADIGLGSVIATGDVSVLGGTAAFEDWLTGQTIADVSSPATEKSTIMTGGAPLVFEAGDSHVLNINIAGTWNATIASLTLTGTVTIYWTFLGA